MGGVLASRRASEALPIYRLADKGRAHSSAGCTKYYFDKKAETSYKRLVAALILTPRSASASFHQSNSVEAGYWLAKRSVIVIGTRTPAIWDHPNLPTSECIVCQSSLSGLVRFLAEGPTSPGARAQGVAPKCCSVSSYPVSATELAATKYVLGTENPRVCWDWLCIPPPLQKTAFSDCWRYIDLLCGVFFFAFFCHRACMYVFPRNLHPQEASYTRGFPTPPDQQNRRLD